MIYLLKHSINFTLINYVWIINFLLKSTINWQCEHVSHFKLIDSVHFRYCFKFWFSFKYLFDLISFAFIYLELRRSIELMAFHRINYANAAFGVVCPHRLKRGVERVYFSNYNLNALTRPDHTWCANEDWTLKNRP